MFNILTNVYSISVKLRKLQRNLPYPIPNMYFRKSGIPVPLKITLQFSQKQNRPETGEIKSRTNSAKFIQISKLKTSNPMMFYMKYPLVILQRIKIPCTNLMEMDLFKAKFDIILTLN